MSQQINKLVGYCTLKLHSGEEIPMKFGFQAITDFCEHFGIKRPNEIYSRFFDFVEREVEVEESGEKRMEVQKFPVCNDIMKFLPAVLWCGANFVAKFETGRGYTLLHAANWIDEIGGSGSEQLPDIYATFFKAVSNGGSPPKPSNLPADIQEKQKKKED